MGKVLQILAGLIGMILVSSTAAAQERVANIGVLAYRGAETTVAEWNPLARYLTAQVEGWAFEIIPVTLVSAPEEIQSGHLQFFVTNPGHYVSLAAEFNLSPLATREKQGGLMRFGNAIIARSDSGILTLDDLHGKDMAAVSPDAFGGFQLAWVALSAQGIDPFEDLNLRFMGFPHDEIINAVLTGEVDAGVIRGGLLEKLAAEGTLALDDFVVLQSNSQMDFPYMVSGQLVPEWPFLAVPGLEKDLRESVALALLATQQKGAEFDLLDIWSAPLSYEGVRALLGGYATRDESEPIETWWYFLPALLLIAALLGFQIWRGQRVEHANSVEPDTTEPEPEDVKEKEQFDRLTKRERQVLALICEGCASKEIAAKLGVSLKTIEYHRANLLQKTRAGTTAQLVQRATRLGYDLGETLGK